MHARTFALAALALLVSRAAVAQPAQTVDPQRHGNLAAAQADIRQAYDRLTAAQKANGYAVGGHAARAKQLLNEANEEIKKAAVTVGKRAGAGR